jgi:hypothetical protein
MCKPLKRFEISSSIVTSFFADILLGLGFMWLKK